MNANATFLHEFCIQLVPPCWRGEAASSSTFVTLSPPIRVTTDSTIHEIGSATHRVRSIRSFRIPHHLTHSSPSPLEKHENLPRITLVLLLLLLLLSLLLLLLLAGITTRFRVCKSFVRLTTVHSETHCCAADDEHDVNDHIAEHCLISCSFLLTVHQCNCHFRLGRVHAHN